MTTATEIMSLPRTTSGSAYWVECQRCKQRTLPNVDGGMAATTAHGLGWRKIDLPNNTTLTLCPECLKRPMSEMAVGE